MPIGSNFDDFLKEEGICQACNEGAIKKVLAWQIEEEMKTQHLKNPKWHGGCTLAARLWIACLMPGIPPSHCPLLRVRCRR